ncbi:helix-turn-helix transcriptional regulator [Yersinia massiliensis]|uniref:DNA-binding protein n=1 Tax=Yersinia frederiksenii TaxID=29484 RepID=A0AAI8ZQ44_YERFR|nr:MULTISPECIES: helix-turn-helix transcriptional regulator [Yersinia]EKN3396437.1 helix-turn-helix transcriptional regulator [Yersinia enterocolitica]MDA5547574.1 helix-turn-helix transcriptional regulator [Yersinia massiliensis]UZM77980.1 helix-turn-helix transcriptional regulator [Yersinia massiliensis]CFQ96748.1 putative DNA-binding protein [Yersinia frederiksenii]HEO8481613.1 helix-turn-helix transcriptional regulator [Yersinia enterocolitica]
MNELADRLKFLMEREALSQKELADLVGTSPQSVNNWIKRSSISKDNARLVSEKTGYSLDWLLNNVGQPKLSHAQNLSNIPPESEWVGVEVWDSKTPLGEDEVEIPYYKSIELAAGNGCSNNEDYNGFKLRFSKTTLRRAGADPKSVMAFPVHGNSMEPVLPDGTTVTVDCANNRIVDGAIYAIDQDEFFRVKLLYRLPGRKLSIRSYNKDEFPDEEADMDDVKIIGRVIHYSVMLV